MQYKNNSWEEKVWRAKWKNIYICSRVSRGRDSSVGPVPHSGTRILDPDEVGIGIRASWT